MSATGILIVIVWEGSAQVATMTWIHVALPPTLGLLWAESVTCEPYGGGGSVTLKID